MYALFLKHVSYLWLCKVGPENLHNFWLFPLKQPFTILSTIRLALNCEAEMFINYAL